MAFNNLKKFEEVKAPVKKLTDEQWTTLKINSKHRYLISTKGRVYSCYTRRIIRGKISSGVLVFEYSPADNNNPVNARTGKMRRTNKNGRLSITVQRLMADTFLPRPRGAFIVVHKDYDKLNNAVDNLKWVKKELSLQVSRNSPKYKDYKVSRSTGMKLSMQQVKKIKELLKKKREGKLKLTIKQIAERFAVADMQIYRIQNGDLWLHSGPPLKQKVVPKKLEKEQVESIKALLQKGEKGVDIARKFAVNTSLISRIKRGKSYR